VSDNEVSATTPEAIRKAVEGTVKKLGRAPDLFLIHNPQVIEEGQIGKAWQILEGLVEDGTLKGTSLGVSNFRPQDFDEVFKVAKIQPTVNRKLLFSTHAQ
jgi:diketogulonate reductase-like aldo/keto reductase